MILTNVLPFLGSLLPWTASPSTGKSQLPSGYHQPSFGQPRSLVRSHTHESIHSLLLATNHSDGQFYDGMTNLPGHSFYWQSQNGWTAIIRQDKLRGRRDFFREVVQSQEALARWPGEDLDHWGVPLVNTFNDDAEWAALANLEAYETYGRTHFLDRAKGVWEFVHTHGFVNSQVIKDGYLKGVKYPTTTLQPSCNGSSMLGGVYWVNGGPPPFDASGNPTIGAVSTGLHALTGAELCRLTGEQEYCDHAYASAGWLDRHVLAENGLIYDGVEGDTCHLNDHQWTYNAGLYIATHAILGHLTDNSTSIRLAERVAHASMTLPVWNTPQGINFDGEGEPAGSADPIGFKSILTRYLHKAYPYLRKDVQASIRHYVNIQYWAMVNLASDDVYAPIRYGRNWTGPAFNLSTEHAQVAALDVLNALELNPDSAFNERGDSSYKVIDIRPPQCGQSRCNCSKDNRIVIDMIHS